MNICEHLLHPARLFPDRAAIVFDGQPLAQQRLRFGLTAEHPHQVRQVGPRRDELRVEPQCGAELRFGRDGVAALRLEAAEVGAVLRAIGMERLLEPFDGAEREQFADYLERFVSSIDDLVAELERQQTP